MARRRLGRHTAPRGVLLSCGSPALSVRRLGRIQRSGSAARDRQKTRRQSRQRLLDPECQFDNQCQQQRCGQGHRSSQLYREPIGCFWMTHCEAPKFDHVSIQISQHRDRWHQQKAPSRCGAAGLSHREWDFQCDGLSRSRSAKPTPIASGSQIESAGFPESMSG
jgi:hypothetical protein